MISAAVGSNPARPVKALEGICEKGNPEERGKLLSEKETRQYQELVGTLRYVSMGMLPNVDFSARCLRCHQTEPRALDWTLAMRVLTYLADTKNVDHVHGDDDED